MLRIEIDRLIDRDFFVSYGNNGNKLKKKLIMVFRIRLIDVIIKGKDDKIIRRKRKNKGHTKRFRLWKNIWKNDKKERRRIRRGKREKKERREKRERKKTNEWDDDGYFYF